MFSDNPIVNDVVLSTINEGTLYAEHCALARNNATLSEWVAHLGTRAMPLWVHNGGTGMKYSWRHEAARLLREYYVQHVNEG